MIYNILVCGVGGQGVMAFSRLLCEAGLIDPRVTTVVGSETRGVAQREGVVSATVRWVVDEPPLPLSPRIPRGQANLVIALELGETLRYVDFYHAGTTIIADTRRIHPKTILAGTKLTYQSDEEILAALRTGFPRCYAFPAHATSAKEFGNYRQAGILLFSGVFAPGSPETPPISLEAFHTAVQQQFPGKRGPLQAVEMGKKHQWSVLNY